MDTRVYTNCVLTVIAVCLVFLAFRTLAQPSVVSAQNTTATWYFEPGLTTVRDPKGTLQTDGKVAVDLRNGDIWGFPATSGLPYPVDVGHSEPPVSKPIYLGNLRCQSNLLRRIRSVFDQIQSRSRFVLHSNAVEECPELS